MLFNKQIEMLKKKTTEVNLEMKNSISQIKKKVSEKLLRK